MILKLWTGLALTLAMVGASGQDRAGRDKATVLLCQADVEGKILALRLELDQSTLLAKVNGESVPASYSPSHVRIHPVPTGPVFVVGMVSGRLLVMTPTGVKVGTGQCSAGTMV
jgi:hypothetical protein